MSAEITHTRLIEFVEANKGEDVDFAQYAYDCGATDFVDQVVDFDWRTDKSIRTYNFKDYYLRPDNYGHYPYYVASFPNKSYLMYEVNSEIFIWACYTEENHRDKGYMTELLNFLKREYPEKKITIDTFNESLRQSCIKLGINVFRR